ncbi:MAG: hypothetical protein OXL96_27115 [Candidatus Poribacteria bacterium]|nr:hypothetical protein [Candidatus Poribacteria bacterium]
MKEIPKVFEYPTRNFNVVGFEISPTEDRMHINKALAEAREHGGDPHNTAGKMRTEDEQLIKRYLGALTENLLVEHLQSELGRSVRVVKKPFETYEKHVDIEIHWDGNMTPLEVRSSFYYAYYLRNVIGRHFKTLGPYSTARKSGETVKDFYLQGVLRQNFNIENIHTLYFTGGAPGRWFLERGTVSTLKQDGAEYLVLPMLEGMDAMEIVNLIKNIIYSK